MNELLLRKYIIASQWKLPRFARWMLAPSVLEVSDFVAGIKHSLFGFNFSFCIVNFEPAVMFNPKSAMPLLLNSSAIALTSSERSEVTSIHEVNNFQRTCELTLIRNGFLYSCTLLYSLLRYADTPSLRYTPCSSFYSLLPAVCLLSTFRRLKPAATF